MEDFVFNAKENEILKLKQKYYGEKKISNNKENNIFVLNAFGEEIKKHNSDLNKLLSDKINKKLNIENNIDNINTNDNRIKKSNNLEKENKFKKDIEEIDERIRKSDF